MWWAVRPTGNERLVQTGDRCRRIDECGRQHCRCWVTTSWATFQVGDRAEGSLERTSQHSDESTQASRSGTRRNVHSTKPDRCAVELKINPISRRPGGQKCRRERDILK